MRSELSLIEAAEKLLLKEKSPVDVYALFDEVVRDWDITEDEKTDLITKFYTDLTTSAKFVYVGDNSWNLKANEKIELWEKDGSFYKEYNEVELPDEYKIDPYATKAKPAKVEVVVEAQPVVEEFTVASVVVEEKEEKVYVEPVVEPVIEDTPLVFDEEDEEYEEEVFDDYDDFDEEKYNEYMDSYEDQYED